MKKREEINSYRIGLIGNSEGAIIVPMVAVKDSSIIAIVLMAGPATRGDAIEDFQKGTGWRGSAVSMNEWQEFFIEYDPLPTAEMVRCPVLILHGDQDELVPVEHANILADAIRKAGNQDVTVKIFTGYNHGFIHIEEANKKDKAGKPLSEILEISPDVIGAISDWMINKLTM